MKTLTSNQDLYDFLRDLSCALKSRGHVELAEAVAPYPPWMPTEFMSESRMALARALRESADKLTPEERADVEHVLQQINDAVDRCR